MLGGDYMNKTLKHGMGTKALSFLLAFIMTFSTLAVGITPMLDIFASGALSKSAYTQPTIKIAVPETIYLTPAASASTFQYFLNNNTSGAAYNYVTTDSQTGYDSTGYIEFTCANYANQTITVTSSDFKKSGETSNAIYSAKANGSGTVTFDIAQNGTLNTAVAAGTTSTITWTFSDSNGNIIAKAYTVAYAPSLMTVATEVARKRASTSVAKGDRAMANGTVWIAGITSYNNNSGGGDGDYMGVYKSTPLTETWTDGTRSACVTTTSCDNSNSDPGSGDFAYNGTGNGFVGYWQRKSDSGTSPYTGRFAGEIVVDWSRTSSNLTQIPNLKTGVDIQEQWDANEKGNGTVSLDIGSTNLRASGSTARYSNKQNYQGFRFSSSFNFAIANQPTSATVTATITARVATSQPSTVLNISYVNKSSLRSAVQTAVNAGYHPEWYTTDTWNAYNAALINACRVLGRPDVTAGDLTTAESNLSAAKTALSRSGITGTLKATHKTPSKTLVTDTNVTYSLGDNTTAAQNSYTGYKCTGYTVSKTTRAITTNTVNENLFNVANYASRIKNGDCKNITWAVAGTVMAFVGTGTDNYTGPYDKANNTYIVQVTPGTTYTYSFTTDQTNYRHFIFSYSSNGAVGYTTAYEINSSSATSGLTNVVRQKVGNVWNVSVDYTVPSGINYLGFRFGTNTKNTLNSTNNITLIKKNSSSSTTAQTSSGSSANTSETITNNCHTETSYTFNYEPITYKIKYENINGASFPHALNYVGTNGNSSEMYNPTTMKYNGEEMGSGFGSWFKVENPTRTGYIFDGWTISGMDTTEHTYYNGSATHFNTQTFDIGTRGDCWEFYNLTATDGAEVTFTAKWTPITYTVTYNGNGNTGGSTAASTHTYDVSKALTANGFTRVYTVTYNYMDATETGAATSTSTYNFDGWATSSGGAVAYTNGQNVTNLASTQGANVNLHAKWKDGGITLPTPKRTGYTFGGWYTAQYGAGDKIGDGGETYYPTSNITIYAKWTKNNYTLTVDPNGGTYKGSANPTDESVAYNDEVNLENPVRSGYMFAGWDQTFEIVDGRTEDTNDPVLNLNKKYPASGYTTHFSDGSGITSTDGQETTGEKYTHYKMVQSSASSADTYRHIYFNTNYNIAAGDTVNIKMFIRKTASSQINWNLYNGNKGNDSGHRVEILSAGAGNLNEWKEISFSRTFTSSDTLGNVGYVELCSGNIKGLSGTISEFDIKEVTTTITHADGTTTVLPSEFYMPARHVTLTAKWREFYYTIKFNGNGATSGSMSDKSLKFAENWNLTPNAFTKKGYYFNGWNPNEDLSGQTTYTDEQQVRGLSAVDKGVVNLYAIWAKNPYTVKFLGNGATGGTGVESESGAYYYTQPFSYDTVQNLYNNKFVRQYTVTYSYDNATGGKDKENDTATYTFTGWKTANGAANEDGKSAYSQGESVNNLTSTKNATISLNAQWDTGSVTLPSPTKTGYTFDGWYDAEIGGNRVGGAGDLYTPEAGITLYAHWTPIRYSVEFDGNDATSGSKSKIENVAYDSPVDLTNDSITGFKRKYTVTYNYNGATGNYGRTSDPAPYTFSKWNTKADGTGTPYEATNDVHNVSSTGGTVPLYAQWTPASVTPPIPTKTGYTFKGWYTDSEFENKAVLDSSGKYTPTATVTLYAKWEANVYNIAFNANGGTGSMDSIQKTCYTDKALPLNDNRITRTGYIFSGWNTEANGSGDAFADGAAVTTDLSFTNDDTVTLYAQWKAITYTVTYNGNDATSGSTATSTHTYDKSEPLTENGFKREYTVKFNGNGADGGDSLADKTAIYSFTGWAESNTGTKKYDDKESVTNLASTQGASVPLYAKWAPGSVTLPTPTKTGYTFGGWYGSSTFTDEAKFGSFTPSADVTLHAKWLVNSYTIIFDANTGSGTMASMPKTCYADASLTANAFTKTGYEFNGWNTEKNGSGIAFADKATIHNDLTYVNASTVTLYAQWKAITYTVTYNGNGATSGLTDSSTHTYDKSEPLTANGFKREYTVKFNGNGADGGDSLDDKTAKYSFTGWAESNTEAKKYDDKESVTNLASTQGASVPLYAKWDSGSVTLPTPTKTGYAFGGWYTSSTFEDGTKVVGSYTPSANITLHARWITRVQDITFDEQFDIAKFSSALTKGTVSEASVNGDTVTIKTTDGQITNADSYKIPVEELQEYIFSYSQYSPDAIGDTKNLQAWITFWDENGNPVQMNSAGSKAYTENELEHFYPNNKTDLANNQNLTADEKKDITFICYYADGDWYQWTPTKWAASRFNGKDSICSGMWNVDVGTHSGTGVYGGTRIYFRAPKGAKYVSVNFGAEVAMTANFKDISLKRVEHYTLPDQITGESYKSTDNFTFNPQTDSFYHPDYDGFTFDKWTIGSGTTQFTNSTDLTQYKSGISLKSNWHENKYRIEFIGNGSNGGSTPAKENVLYSEEVTLTNGFTRGYNITYKNYNETGDTTDVAGYSFTGWTDAGGTTYSNNAKVSKLAAKDKDNDEIKLTAQWTYASLTLPTPTKAGYIFAGWYSDSSFTNFVGFGGDSYTPTGTATFHAKWIPAPLDVTYDEMFDISKYSGKNADVSGNTLTVTSNETNSGVQYSVQPGKEYVLSYNEAVGPGAENTAAPIIRFYDANGNAVAYSTEAYNFTDINQYYVPNNVSEGWLKTDKIIAIIRYYTSDDVIYAFLHHDSYSGLNNRLDFGLNVGDEAAGNKKCAYYFIVPANAAYSTVEFYSTNGTTTYNDISFSRVEHYTLPEQVAGGAFTGAAYRSADGYDITPPARDGFTFNYWKNTATGAEFDPDTLNDYPNGVTLESVWTEHTYTVHFDGNGNTNAGASIADITGKKYTETFNLPYNTLPDDKSVFEKTGWYFAGWSADPYAKADDEGVYSEGEPVSKLAAKVNNPDEITLYAVWSRICYTINYYSKPDVLEYTQEREYGDEKLLENNFFSSEKVYFIYGDEGPDVEEKYKCTGEHPESKDVSYRIKGWARTYNGEVAYAGDFKGDLTDADGKLLKHNSTIDLYPSWDTGIEFVLPNPEREGLDLVGWYTIGDWEKIQEDQQYQEMRYLWNLIAEEKKYPEFIKDAMPDGWGESVTEPQIPEDFIDSYNGNIDDLDKQELWNLIAEVKKYPAFVKDAMPADWGTMNPPVPEGFTYDGDINQLSMSELWNLIAAQGFDGFAEDAMPDGWGEMIPPIPDDFTYDGEIDVQSQYYVGKGGERVTIDNPGTLYAVWMDTTSPDITLKGITNNCAAQQTVTVTFGDAGKLGRYYFGNDIAASADKYIAFEDGIINKTLDLTVSDGGIYYLYLYDKSDNFNYTTYTFYKTEFDGERTANETTAAVVTYSGNSITFSDEIKNIARAGYNYNGWFENETYSGTAYRDSYTPVKNTVLHAGWTPNVVRFNENKTVDDSRVTENLIAPTWKSSFDGLTVTRDSSETIKVSGTQTSDVTLFTSPFDPDAETNYRVTVELCGGTVAGDGYLVVEFTTTSGEVLGEDIKYIYDYSTGANGSAVFSFNSEQAGKIGGIRVWLCGGSGNTFSDYQFRVKLEKASAGDAYAYSKNAAHIVAPASVYASLPTPERTGYTFDGWSTVIDGEAVSNTFNFGAVVGTQTFYAKWKANTYTIVYTGGSANYINFEAGNEPKQTCTYDTDFYLLAEEAVKNYYERKFKVTYYPDCEDATIEGEKGPIEIEVKSTFAGWKDENTGKVYTAELEIKELQKNLTSVNGGIIELVAQWKDTEITLPTAERPVGPAGEKYNLQGWFESKADNAKRLGGAGTKYTVSADTDFYAKWTPVDIKDKNIAYDFAEKTTFSVIDVNGYDIIPANLKEAKVIIGSGLKNSELIHMPTANSNINEGFSGSYSVQFLDGGSTNLIFSIPDGEDDENYTNFKNALTQQSTVLFLSGSDSFTGTASFYFEFAFIEEGEAEDKWQYITGKINIVPANSVYYEETVFDVNDTINEEDENYGSEWAAEGTKSLDSNAGVIEYQAYGYSREYRGSMTYSAGTAIKADVSEFRPSSKMREFKFSGAGFELVSDCGPNTSALMVYVWRCVGENYRLIANSVVDTRITDENLVSDGLLKQVPVYHFLSTETAEYLVQVCAIYVETELSEDVVQGTKSFNELTDELEEIGVKVDEKLLEVKAVNKAEAEEAQAEEIIFNRYSPIDVLKAVTAEQRLLGTGEDTSTGYIDGIRVYKPTEDESSYYSWEKDATFFNILQRTRDEAGALTEYQVDGQNDMIDEIYLAPKNGENISSTAFSIDGFESGKNRIMVSLRAANGETEVYVSGGEGSTGKIVINLDHSTEMYYDITDAVVNGTVVISNNGNGYAAVCNLKVTADNGTINVTPLAPQKIEGIRAMLSSVASLSNIAYTPLVEPKPQKEEQGEQGEQGDNPPSGDTAAVKIFKFEKSTNSVEVEYRSTVKFYAVEAAIPGGSKLCWYLNGKRDYASDGKGILVLTELTEQTAVQAKILGEDGSELAESGKVTVKVKGGFFQKLIAFIRGLFRKLPVYDFKPNK